ncbi:hypothetical protein JZ751_012329 [Albula glossodonta]|uniref:Secreted protein n=1 Tax=Albula glossodonta TaxID=121402 RepID=A0A8T2PS76_9TELE|nr:hypothetical protein JZ751_012329 [Albula glossodonta]
MTAGQWAPVGLIGLRLWFTLLHQLRGVITAQQFVSQAPVLRGHCKSSPHFVSENELLVSFETPLFHSNICWTGAMLPGLCLHRQTDGQTD